MKSILPLLTLSSLLALTLPAWAGGSLDDDLGSYREHKSPADRGSPQHFALEFRGGPYRPEIDSAFSNGAQPYQATFGSSPAIALGLEIDWQAYRIPYVGTIGPGFGVGYFNQSAVANNLSGGPSGEHTYMTIFPMYLVGVLRIDELAREASIPLVPYGKAGFGYGLWTTGNDGGVSVRDGVRGEGHTFGLHFAAGLALQLDFLDMDTAVRFDESIGVNHTYFFVEWMRNPLDGLFATAPELRIGTSTWVLGLAFEM